MTTNAHLPTAFLEPRGPARELTAVDLDSPLRYTESVSLATKGRNVYCNFEG